VSLPRLCPSVPSYSGPYAIDQDSLLRFYAVLRLALPSADLVGSTRELPEVRRRLLEAGITQMSAGSVTVPGGYGEGRTEGGQFDTSDRRCVSEVVEDLESLGYRVRWTGETRPVTDHNGARN
jgi:2-iminoacetate synthase